MTKQLTGPERALGEGACRLCGGALLERFGLTVLRKHTVRYHECQFCGSLQTEPPHWLEEAYASNLSDLDTGSGQRNLTNLAACFLVSRIFRANDVIDFGGGDGLLCRLLRDYAINCFVRDKHAAASYAQGFTQADFAVPQMLIAFEVMEHFAEPKVEWEQLFALGPRVLLASTTLYRRQGKDWWYLSPESGQHIFFYSERALQWIAQQHDCRVLVSGTFILFVRQSECSGMRLLLARLALNRYLCRLARAFIVLLPTPGVWADREARRKAVGPAVAND